MNITKFRCMEHHGNINRSVSAQNYIIGHTKSCEECLKVEAINKFEIQENKAYSKLLNY